MFQKIYSKINPKIQVEGRHQAEQGRTEQRQTNPTQTIQQDCKSQSHIYTEMIDRQQHQDQLGGLSVEAPQVHVDYLNTPHTHMTGRKHMSIRRDKT